MLPLDQLALLDNPLDSKFIKGITMNKLVTKNSLLKKRSVLNVKSISNSGNSKKTPKGSIFKPMADSMEKNKSVSCIPLISLDGCNLTLPIPESKRDNVYFKLDELKAKELKSGGMAENKQYKANCFREHGQYKSYVVISVKTKKMYSLVYVGYRPIGNQNPLWIRFNPAHFTQYGYKVLKKKLAKILGMRLLLKSFAKAIPTRLDIAVDITGITPDYLLADMREARDSAIHLKGGRVSSMTMGTNRSTTAVIVYSKALGTRIEVRLRRMNQSTKPVIFKTLANSLPANPFKRLDIYQVDEAKMVSSQIRLVVAAARAMGLKGALQTLDEKNRRIVRKQLAFSKVEHFDADHVWDKVRKLLEPLSILYTTETETSK